MIKSYSELMCLKTFEERFHYLKLDGKVGQTTFGFNRYLNQTLYQSQFWKSIRAKVLIRDGGCDLGIEDREILKYPTIHHINPLILDDVISEADCVYDLNNLITTDPNTHKAIHFGDESLLFLLPKERRKGDTCPWKVY